MFVSIKQVICTDLFWNIGKWGVLNLYSREFRYLLVGETSQGRRFWWARKWLWFHLSVNNHIHTIVIHSHGLNIKPWRGFAIFSLICIPLEAQVHMCLSVCCSRLDIYTSYLHFANIPMTTCFHLVRHQIDRKKDRKTVSNRASSSPSSLMDELDCSTTGIHHF